MRVLTLTNLYPNPLQPNRANHIRQQLRHVAQHVEVSIISPIAWTEEWNQRRRGGAMPQSRHAVVDDLRVEYPRYWYTPKILRGLYGHFLTESIRGSFQKALKEFKPDLVYAPWAYPDGWAAVRLGHRAGLPVVIKVVGSDVLLLSSNPQKRQGTIEALRKADAIIAVSQDLARRVIEFGVESQKVHVIYDGIDPDKFHPGSKAEALSRIGHTSSEPMILFVGNLVPVKGLEILIEACRRLYDRCIGFSCRIIGEGSLRTTLKKQVSQSGLSRHIQFIGAVRNEDLPAWFQAATVVALPSRSEGVPNVLLEAAACGTPFVASRIGGIPEIAHLGECRLVPANSPTHLADALGKYLVEPPDPYCKASPVMRTRAQSALDVLTVFEETLKERMVPSTENKSYREQEHAGSTSHV